MRSPTVAGSFYPADAAELKKAIRSSFLGKFGPGKLPENVKSNKLVYGVVSPHAGYSYSGMCAAHSYKAIAEAEKPETVVILGTNHTGYVESDFAVSMEDFETPLGIVRNDKELSGLLISNGKGLCGKTARDEIAHKNEHSIEVQLPFLQFILGKIKIVPIICQVTSFNKYAELAKLLVETAKKLKRKICVVASGDLTHYGSVYGFTPFVSDVKKNLYELDRKAIDLILKFKTKDFLDYSSKTTICGSAAIAVCIETCKLLGSKKAELLKYYTSGDVTGDFTSAVGYSSIVFN